MKKNKPKTKAHPNKANQLKNQNKATWLGHPDDHEPTTEVKKEDIKP